MDAKLTVRGRTFARLRTAIEAILKFILRRHVAPAPGQACTARHLYLGTDLADRGDVWDAMYGAGRWCCLHGVRQVPHNSVVVGYLRHYKLGGSVLDVGCGDGALLPALRTCGYSRYVGIDVSTAAIDRIADQRDDRTSLIVGDAECARPPGRFDVVLFNESLYYLSNPLEVLRRYSRDHAELNGILIVSLSDRSPRTRSVVREIRKRMLVLHDVTIGLDGAKWTVLVLDARRSTAGE